MKQQQRDGNLVVGQSGASPEQKDAQWLIWSNEHHAWWAADRCGYRKSPDDAGRYTLESAMDICSVRSWADGVPPETMIHESAVWFGNKRPSVSVSAQENATTK